MGQSLKCIKVTTLGPRTLYCSLSSAYNFYKQFEPRSCPTFCRTRPWFKLFAMFWIIDAITEIISRKKLIFEIKKKSADDSNMN